jgi:lipopolysaccharide/colanic/teichoic acid biosynthesis glycosyltransferase
LDSITNSALKRGIDLRGAIAFYPEDESISSQDRGFEQSSHLAGQSAQPIEVSALSQQTERIPNNTAAKSIAFPKYPAWKRFIDISFSASGLLAASPFLLLVAILIKLTSKGPVFFTQWRTGLRGKPFRIYKLRTMVVDAEELKVALQKLNERDGPAFKIKDDPRVTSVGRFLRATGFDELPQLWNVLIGEMAIVGPRPLPVDEDAQCLAWHRRRLDTKPGITCLWQISKSRKMTFDEWMRLDIRYLEERTLWNDISLMFRTIFAVILGRVGH